MFKNQDTDLQLEIYWQKEAPIGRYNVPIVGRTVLLIFSKLLNMLPTPTTSKEKSFLKCLASRGQLFRP